MKVQIYNYNDELVTVEYFQLLQWKGAISLEDQGMTNSRGSVTAHVKRLLSFPRYSPRSVLLKHLQDTINSLIIEKRKADHHTKMGGDAVILTDGVES